MIQKKAPSAKQWIEQYEVDTGIDDSYTVSKKFDGTWACSCKRWVFHPKPKVNCKHIGAVLSSIGEAVPIFQQPPVVKKRAVEEFADKFWKGLIPGVVSRQEALRFAEAFAEETRGFEPVVEPEPELVSTEFKITRKFRLV